MTVADELAEARARLEEVLALLDRYDLHMIAADVSSALDRMHHIPPAKLPNASANRESGSD